MNSNRILYLTDPMYPHEAVSKGYVNRKFLNLSFLHYEGHIPSLEGSISKTRFFVSVSSRLNPFKDGWLAFNPGKGGEWVTRREGAGAWIEISCPTPVRIWKIRLTGQSSITNKITSWKLSGRAYIDDTLTDMYASQTELDPFMQEFLISADRAYRIYRLTVISRG